MNQLLATIERRARWSAFAIVVVLLCVAMTWRIVVPVADRYFRENAGPGPTLYLPAGIKLRLGDKVVSVSGADDCHRNKSWLFGPETGSLVDDRGCISLGGKTATVLYREHGQLVTEVLTVVHGEAGVSLRRLDGSPVIAVQ